MQGRYPVSVGEGKWHHDCSPNFTMSREWRTDHSIYQVPASENIRELYSVQMVSGWQVVNVLIRIAVISISYKDEPWIFYDKSISNTLWAGFKPQGVLNPFPCIKIVDTDAFFCKNSFLICWSWEFTRGNARGFSSALFWLLMPCFRGKETKCQGKCITFINLKKKYLGHISS